MKAKASILIIFLLDAMYIIQIVAYAILKSDLTRGLPVTPTCLLWQTVKTQMKFHTMCYIKLKIIICDPSLHTMYHSKCLTVSNQRDESTSEKGCACIYVVR